MTQKYGENNWDRLALSDTGNNTGNMEMNENMLWHVGGERDGNDVQILYFCGKEPLLGLLKIEKSYGKTEQSAEICSDSKKRGRIYHQNSGKLIWK